MGLLDWLIPRTTVLGIDAPTSARLTGTLAPNCPMVRSPFSQREACVLGWFISRRIPERAGGGSTRRSADGTPREEHYRLERSGGFVAPWLILDVSGRAVRIATSELDVAIAAGDFYGELAPTELPAEYRISGPIQNVALHYGERWLSSGDTVVLKARVRRVASSPVSYRDAPDLAPDAEYETIGPATLVDTIGQQLGVRPVTLAG